MLNVLNKYLKRGVKEYKKYMKGVLKVSQKKQGENVENKEGRKLKIPVTLNSEQLKLIENYEGILGNTKAEIIRNIVINWILNQGIKGGENEKN